MKEETGRGACMGRRGGVAGRGGGFGGGFQFMGKRVGSRLEDKVGVVRKDRSWLGVRSGWEGGPSAWRADAMCVRMPGAIRWGWWML